MALILEVKGGRLAGRKIDVPDGGKVTIGRAPDRANFAVPHDSFMSSVHFSVECAAEGSRVKDRKSSNGTYLNGTKITEAALAEGDEIRSGRTVFVVRIAAAKPTANTEQVVTPPAAKPTAPPPAPVEEKVPPPVVEPVVPAPKPPAKPAPAEREPMRSPQPVAEAPATKQPAPPEPKKQPPAKPAEPRPVAAAPPTGPALVTIKSWQFAKVPEGWEAQGEFGIQRTGEDVFPSNVVATEEMLGLSTLQRFIEAQVAMLRQYLREPRIEASLPPTVPGAEETVALDIRYSTKDEKVILLRRIFARSGKHVGVLTVTTLEKDLEEIRPALDTILAGVSFQPQEE